MIKSIKKHKNIIIIACLSIVFFIITSSFNYLVQDPNHVKWSSPDETANYFFTKNFAINKQLSVFDPAAVLGNNMLMPRSFRSDFGWLKPVSFLGIILVYGSIAKVVGIAIIPLLTPLFAALGLFIFYLLIKKIFNTRIALWSSVLLSTFPVYIYYTVRSMFHNILFVDLLIFSTYFLLLAGYHKNIKRKFVSWKLHKRECLNLLYSFLGGAFLGLAIITRTSELLWLLPVLFIIFLFYIRRIGITKFILIIAGIAIAILPVIYWNQILYTSPVYGGYNEMNRSLNDISYNSKEMLQEIERGDFSHVRSYLYSLKNNIFYFGFKSEQSIEMFQHYVIEMFPYLLYISLFGLLFLMGENTFKYKKKYLVYVLVLFILSSILVFYYGSWKFNDNPNIKHFTIGNSYTRYWLPIYIMLIPLASLAIIRFSRAIVFVKDNNRSRKLIATGFQIIIIVFLAINSLAFVLYGSEEGLMYLYYNNKIEQRNAHQVFSLTDNNSIIITKYHDKFFFPERRVIVGSFPNEEIFYTCDKLIQHYPIYYYSFFLDKKAVQYLNDRKLIKHNFKLKLVQKFGIKFGLYKLVKNNE